MERFPVYVISMNESPNSPFSPSVPVAAPAMTDETDANLLVYMSWKDDDGPNAKEAWKELYGRHVVYLYACCAKTAVAKLGPEAIEDLVVDTFQRAYERAHTFQADGLTGKDRAEISKIVRAWLGKIAHRLACDKLRNREEVTRPEVHLSQEHWQDIPGRELAEDRSEPQVVAIVREAMQTVLNEQEREALREWFQWYDPEREHQRLPNDVAQDIANHLNTTPERMRKIRHIALKKVEVEVINRLGRSPFTR